MQVYLLAKRLWMSVSLCGFGPAVYDLMPGREGDKAGIYMSWSTSLHVHLGVV